MPSVVHPAALADPENGEAADRPASRVCPAPDPRVPDDLASAIAGAARAENASALLGVFALNEYPIFKAIFGEGSVRQLMAEVSERILAALRERDLLVDLGDGELAILVPGIDDAGAAVAVAERLLRRCRGIYWLGRQRVQARAHLGLALVPRDGRDARELLQRARIALHEAKAPHSAPYRVFNPILSEKLRERVWLAGELEEAIQENRLELHYQPLFAIDSRQTIGAEALVRLRSTQGQLIGPAQFIPLAEESGLIPAIGTWVLNEACRQLASWRPAKHLNIAVNVSPLQLADSNFVESIDAAVENAGIDYQDLTLEITESLVLDCLPLVEQRFEALSDRGVRIALDDFGTGFSALAYLARLPISTVKIDRSFIQRVPDNRQATRVTSAVIAMAQQLGMTVVAEGVENEPQFRFLAEAGCHFGQGFGYAKPQRPQDFLHAISRIPDWSS